MKSSKEKRVDYISGLYQVAQDYLVYNQTLKSTFYNNMNPDRALNKNVNPFNDQLKNNSINIFK